MTLLLRGRVMNELIYKDLAISALNAHLDTIPMVNSGVNNMIRRDEVMNCRSIVKDVKGLPQEELLDDGTLVVWTNTDMSKFSRVNVRQIGTHYGDLFYPDED